MVAILYPGRDADGAAILAEALIARLEQQPLPSWASRLRLRIGVAGMSPSFRGVDDLYNHVHDLMGQVGLVLVPESTEVQRAAYQSGTGGRSNHVAVVVIYRWYAEDGSSIPVQIPGEGMDAGDKGTGKALSMANKYALIQSLSLPTGEPDSDDFQTEGTPAVRPASDQAPHPNQDQSPVLGGGPSPAAPLTDTSRVPYKDVDDGMAFISKITNPAEQSAVRRRIFDSVDTQRITGAQANQLMEHLKTHVNELRRA